ncbi:MAG: hypothetical protein ACTSO5_05750 [Candidatus Heimdallarchaeaceae archaeon]
MKNKKKKLSLCLSVLIIGFLVGSSSLNNNNLKAFLEEKNDLYTVDSYDSSTWNWTTTEVISDDNSDFSYVPSLAVDSAGSVHIAWESVDLGGTLADHKISYKRWDALTQSWTTTEIISTESTTGSFNPCVAVDSNNNLHIVWGDETDYNGCGADRDIFYKRWRDIFYKRWNAGSSSWTTTEVVSTESTGYSRNPSLAVDSFGNPHVVWDEVNDIFYKYWNDTSSSWTSAVDISNPNPWGATSLPDIDVDIYGNVHVVWEQMGGASIETHYTRWNVSSSSWTTSVEVSAGIYYDSLEPSIDSDALCNVYVAWAGNDDSTGWDIYCRKWDVDLGNWLTREFVSTETTEHLKNPSLCVDIFDNIHVAWEDSTNYALSGTDWDIFYKIHLILHGQSQK